MKILHVLDHSLPLQSGYTFRTRAILREQQRRGWDVLALTSSKHGRFDSPTEVIDGLRFHRVTSAAGSLAALPVFGQLDVVRRLERDLEKLVEREQPDLLHAHSPCLTALASLRVAARRRLPVVYEVRAFWEDAAVDHGTSREGGPRYRLSRALETYALKRVAQVTTICEGLRREICGRGIPAEQVTTIPNSIDPAQFTMSPPRDAALARQLGLEGGVVLGFIGSFYAYEGLAALIAVMPELLRVVPTVRLLLVGGGPEENRLRTQIKDAGLEERIVMPGRIAHAEVARHYALVDLLVFPRMPMRLTELVTPLKPLEAMAQGRCVIASDVGGHRELIEDGRTGWLFRAGDAKSLVETVRRVVEGRDAWTQVRERAREYVVRERNWTATVARYESVYDRALARLH